MTTPLLPDGEALVLAALRETLPAEYAATVDVDLPPEWMTKLPLAVVNRITGAATDPRFLDAPIFSVTVFATDRAQGSLLARAVRRCLFDACRAQYTGGDGYLSSFEEITGPWCAPNDTTGAFPDVFRWPAIYLIRTRPLA